MGDGASMGDGVVVPGVGECDVASVTGVVEICSGREDPGTRTSEGGVGDVSVEGSDAGELRRVGAPDIVSLLARGGIVGPVRATPPQ